MRFKRTDNITFADLKGIGIQRRNTASIEEIAYKNDHSTEHRLWQDMLYSVEELDPRWKKYDSFLSDMGKAPALTISIGKLDIDKGYQPGNCFWVVPKHRHKATKVMRTFEANNKNLNHTEICDNQSAFAHKWDLSATSISRCLNGSQKCHRGWTFKLTDDPVSVHTAKSRLFL